MWKHSKIVCLALVALGFSLLPAPVNGQPLTRFGAALGEPGLKVSSGDAVIALSLTLPAWNIQHGPSNADAYDEVAVAGWGTTTTPGAPRLPAYDVTIGIPPHATPHLEIVDASGHTVIPGYRLAINSSPQLSLVERHR